VRTPETPKLRVRLQAEGNVGFRPIADVWTACQPEAMINQANLDALRNDALVAWLHPGADRARFLRFIAALEPELRADVEQGARAAREGLVEFLSKPFPGDQDESLFAAAIRAHLVIQFPWLSEAGLEALIHHTDSASAWDRVI
jgi:hypothetical protein